MKYLAIIFLLFACAKEEETYTKAEIYSMAIKHDEKAELIIPESIEEGVKCSEYGPGCKAAFLAKIFGLEIRVIEYENSEFARKDAITMGEFYKGTWVFDEIAGEPVLERFVTKVYKATNPAREILEEKRKFEEAKAKEERERKRKEKNL